MIKNYTIVNGIQLHWRTIRCTPTFNFFNILAKTNRHLKLIKHKIAEFEEVCILFYFNIILNTTGCPLLKLSLLVKLVMSVSIKFKKQSREIFCQHLLQSSVSQTPNYTKIRIPYTSPASRFTNQKITILRIKYEIKFLYMKKKTN